jgi:pimeloyl-ACP methyl ester carboxylesterase
MGEPRLRRVLRAGRRRALRPPVGRLPARRREPSAAAALGRANWETDVRPHLGAIRAPTLVLNRRGDPIGPPDAARYMAERIPGARFVELQGDDHVLWLGDLEAPCGEIEHFITGVHPW